MCFNKEVSFLIFFFAILVAIKCFLQKRYYDGILVLTYGIIQFYEYLIWLGINSKLNYVASLLLCITLSIQPLSIALGQHFFTPTQDKEKILSYANFAIIGLYMLIFWGYLIVTTQKFSNKELMSVPKGRLIWTIMTKSNHILLSIMYVITSIIVFYLARDYLVLGLFIATLVAANIYNSLSGNLTRESVVGTVWCFFAIVLIVAFGIFIG